MRRIAHLVTLGSFALVSSAPSLAHAQNAPPPPKTAASPDQAPRAPIAAAPTPSQPVAPPRSDAKPIGTPIDPGFEHKPPKAPGDKVTLQLEDADLSELVRFIGELTGKKFVIASPKLAKVKATVFAPQKVTVAEAYQAFLAVLSANGLTIVPQSGFYKIVESQDVSRQLTPLEQGDLPREERYVTRIHRLTHLSAEEVANNVLSKLATKDATIVPYPAGNLLIITETAANLRRLLDVLSAIDDAGEEDKMWLLPLKYVSAAQLEKQLVEILDLKKKADVSSGPLHVARVLAVERPNALVIVATKASYVRIVDLLRQLDVAPSNESQVHVVPLQHADAKKIVGPINEALGGPAAMPSPGGGARPPTTSAPSAPATVLEAAAKVSADETTNALIVTATQRDFVQIKDVISALDKPKKQVYIEAVVLDVSVERGLDLGVAFHGGTNHEAAIGPGGKDQTTYGGFRPLTSASPGANDLQAFALGVRGPEIPANLIPGVSSIPSFGALLTAVATSRAADILSTPSVIASDNTTAELKVQLQTSLQPNAPQTSIVPSVLQGAGNSAAAAAAMQIPSFGGSVGQNYRAIGPKIKVTPHLNDSDEVRLDVDELISDIQSAPDKGDTFGTVSFLERSAQTTLTVKDGETVVIGGLVRNRVARSETKVPVLGDIPLLGMLFRTRSDRLEKSNLVLILTPHIIRDQTDLKRVFQRKMEERQELVDRESIFNNEKWTPPHDWHRTRGLLGDIRLAHRDADARRKEQEDRAPKPLEPTAIDPLDLPVPQGPAGGSGKGPTATPSSSGGGGAAPPVRPNIVER